MTFRGMFHTEVVERCGYARTMAPRFQVYAHLGYPKCASTSIQGLLGSAKVAYLGKLNTRVATKIGQAKGLATPYPRFVTEDIGRVVRVELPSSPEPVYDRDDVAQALRSGVDSVLKRRHSAVYLSDEILSGIGLSLYRQNRVDVGTIARRLVEGFDADTTFVLVIRSQPAMLWSYYRQLLVLGYPLSFEAFLRDQALVPTKTEGNRASLNGIVPHLLYDKVREVIGAHGVVQMVPFEAMISGQPGLDTFLTAMGLPTGLELPHRNKAVEDLERTIARNMVDRRGAARFVPQGVHRWDKANLRAQGRSVPSMTGWAEKVSPELTALFAASNARLAAATGLDLRGFGYPMPD